MASSSFLWFAQGDAEVEVGQGVVGLEPDQLAGYGDGLFECLGGLLRPTTPVQLRPRQLK